MAIYKIYCCILFVCVYILHINGESLDINLDSTPVRLVLNSPYTKLGSKRIKLVRRFLLLHITLLFQSIPNSLHKYDKTLL